MAIGMMNMLARGIMGKGRSKAAAASSSIGNDISDGTASAVGSAVGARKGSVIGGLASGAFKAGMTFAGAITGGALAGPGGIAAGLFGGNALGDKITTGAGEIGSNVSGLWQEGKLNRPDKPLAGMKDAFKEKTGFESIRQFGDPTTAAAIGGNACRGSWSTQVLRCGTCRDCRGRRRGWQYG